MGLGNVSLANPKPMTQGVEPGSTVSGTSMTKLATIAQKEVKPGEISANANNAMRNQLLSFALNSLGVKEFDGLPQSVKEALNTGINKDGVESLSLSDRMVLVMNAVDASNKSALSLKVPKKMYAGMQALESGQNSVKSCLGDNFKAFQDAAHAVYNGLKNGMPDRTSLLLRLTAYQDQLDIAMKAAKANFIVPTGYDRDVDDPMKLCPEYQLADEVRGYVETLIDQIKNSRSDANKPVGSLKGSGPYEMKSLVVDQKLINAVWNLGVTDAEGSIIDNLDIPDDLDARFDTLSKNVAYNMSEGKMDIDACRGYAEFSALLDSFKDAHKTLSANPDTILMGSLVLKPFNTAQLNAINFVQREIAWMLAQSNGN